MTVRWPLAAFVYNLFIVIAYAARKYVVKLSGQKSAPIRISKRKLLIPSTASFAGSVLGIASVGFIASHFSIPLLIAPFGASAVLLFSVYDSPLAQPRNTVFGHVLSALVGAVVSIVHITYFGGDVIGTSRYVPIAIAVSLSIFLMQVLRITHPPAGATAFIASTAAISANSFSTLVIAVAAGSLILVAIAVIFNSAVPGRRYPVYW